MFRVTYSSKGKVLGWREGGGREGGGREDGRKGGGRWREGGRGRRGREGREREEGVAYSTWLTIQIRVELRRMHTCLCAYVCVRMCVCECMRVYDRALSSITWVEKIVDGNFGDL